MIRIFLVSFAQIFLVSFNARNAVQSRYVLAFCASLAVTCFNVLNTKFLVEGGFSPPLIIATGLGGALGVMAGPYVHKRFIRKKNVNDW